MNEKVFEIILSKTHKFLEEKGIKIVSEQTLMQALPFVIECVETVQDEGINGEEKKKLAIRVIQFILEQTSIGAGKKAVLFDLINGGTLDITIDIIIDASKGRFELNRKTRSKLFMCLGSCFKSLGRKRNEHQPVTVTEVAVV